MESGIKLKQNPEEVASFLSRLLVSWTLPILKKGAKSTIEICNVYRPLTVDESERVTARLEREWNKELEKLKTVEYTIGKDGKKVLTKSAQMPSLFRALVRTFFWDNIKGMLILTIECVILRSLMPVFQGEVIKYFNIHSKNSKNDAFYFGLGLLICTFGISFCMHHFFMSCEQIGIRIRVACSALVYRKLLRIGKTSLDQTAAGQVVNLLSNDLSRFDVCLSFLHHLWCAPIQIIIIAVITWQYAGVAALIGWGCLILASLPMFPIVGKLSGALRVKIAVMSDKRIQIMNELVSGIQVIKMYSWEMPFARIVSDTRVDEILFIKKSSYIHAFIKFIIIVLERLALFISMITYSLLGNTLNAQITFVLAAFYTNLRMAIGVFLPQAFVFLGETLVSIRRVKQFLLLDELNSKVEVLRDPSKSLVLGVKYQPENKLVRVKFEHVCANWIPGQLPPTLFNVSLQIDGGQLCAIIGLVGSGKSAILNLILRELPIGAGTLSLRQNLDLETKDTRASYIVDNPNLTISYACQDAWLFTATVKDNILFGQSFDEDRYNKVVEVCALIRDFQLLPNGDKTLVGERGVSLSGGQRARINLARAVYKKADLYLLDDPLSAVDTKVGQHLFQKCICEFLGDKTRILVTHQLQFLENVDKIVLLEKGTVVCQGKYDQLIATNTEFANILDKISGKDEKEEEATLDNKVAEQNKSRLKNSATLRKRIPKRDKTMMLEIESSDNSDIKPAVKKNEEEYSNEMISNDVYMKYFRSGGSWLTLILLLFLHIISQVSNSGNDYWISYWTNTEYMRTKAINNNMTEQETVYWTNNSFLSHFGLDEYGFAPADTFIYIYTFTICMVIITNFIRCMCFVNVTTKASYSLHNDMFNNVLRATMHFFNVNPSGRILNRFSKDMGAMDELLPKNLMETIQILFMLIGILILVAIINQWMIIVSIILLIILYYTRMFYMKSINPLKRIEGVTKSPVFSHVNATLTGLTTIRSGGQIIEKMMIKQFDSFQDIHTGTNYLLVAVSTSFCVVIDIFCDIFVALVTFSLIVMKNGRKHIANI